EEDGIRDRNVTGAQTCALPISDAAKTLLVPGFDEIILGYKVRSATLDPDHEKSVVPGGNGMFKNTVISGSRARGTWKRSPRKTRSEERRVGEGCRARA